MITAKKDKDKCRDERASEEHSSRTVLSRIWKLETGAANKARPRQIHGYKRWSREEQFWILKGHSVWVNHPYCSPPSSCYFQHLRAQMIALFIYSFTHWFIHSSICSCNKEFMECLSIRIFFFFSPPFHGWFQRKTAKGQFLFLSADEPGKLHTFSSGYLKALGSRHNPAHQTRWEGRGQLACRDSPWTPSCLSWFK